MSRGGSGRLPSHSPKQEPRTGVDPVSQAGHTDTLKNTLPEVDTYIETAAEFAQPILKRLRQLFHQACPEIQESIKWS